MAWRVLIATALASSLATRAGATAPGPADWPTYGHDVHRTFSASTTLDQTSVRTLAPAWFFPTGDAVTANPIEVGGSIYVGSWDGNFYAIDAVSGQLRWSFTVDAQGAVHPQPGNRQPGDATSDGGIITSAAYFLPQLGSRPDLVIFGAGYTLYALVANGDAFGHEAGSLYWKHAYTGRPELPPDPDNDGSRIFSSPAVVGTHVLFSVDADGASGYRGYLVSADVSTGNPQWIRELDVDTNGNILNDGCGNVWASPTIIERMNLEVVAVSDCHYNGTPPYHERVLAVNIGDGTIRWTFTPPRLLQGDPACDWDFGATANVGTDSRGAPTFLGVAGKDGTYYSLDPATGNLRWQHNVVFGGFAGGFIGSTAYDGLRVYGATALGDFGRFEPSPNAAGCRPGDPQDQLIQEPSMHAFDVATGNLVWQQVLSQSFGATTVAGGMTFVGTGISKQIQIRDAGSGLLLNTLALPAGSDSGVVVAGNALFFGTGTSEQGTPAGVFAYTPLGGSPVLRTPPQGTIIFWDHDEREDFFVDPAGPSGTIVPTWDPNGQMCLFPDGSGRFVTGYNPTLPDQGLGTFPLKDPPVGEAVWDEHGNFTGQTIFVPGPYTNPGSTVGGDIPPDQANGNTFNDNGTYTGCVFDSRGNLFAVDIGQAQGQFPPPDNGRLIEWFADTNYTTYCILFGPTMGGDAGTGHHVDGSGGLRDPGTLARDDADNIYVPEGGALDPATGQLPGFGRVLEFLRSSFPADASRCPGPSNMPLAPVSVQVFIQGSPASQPFPLGIARDPSTHRWAVSSVIGSPAIAWYNDDGTPYAGKGPLPAGNYSPFGLAFTPAGDLYFVDIHISCGAPNPDGSLNCGPQDNAGGVYRVTFTAGVPSLPAAIATQLNYPTSVTACDPTVQTCPMRASSGTGTSNCGDPSGEHQVTWAPTTLWPPNHQFESVTITYSDTNQSHDLTLTITGVSDNQTVGGVELNGAGDTSPDWQVTNPGGTGRGSVSAAVNVRSERSGTGTDRVYTITYIARSRNGLLEDNDCDGTATVTVPQYCANGSCR